MKKEFRLPDVGEGLTEADIVAWHVQPGDTVTINQIIVDIETAKAVVELPSPFAGTVSALLVEVGETVDVGVPIIAIEVPDAAGAGPAPAAPDSTRDNPPDSTRQNTRNNTPDNTADHTAPEEAGKAKNAPPEAPARQPVLVGYGVKPGSTSRRPRKKQPPTRPGSYPATPSAPPLGGPPPAGGPGGTPPFPAGIKLPPGIPTPGGSSGKPARALAKPPVRRLARDLGIDLAGLAGSGPEGSVTRNDVERAAGEARTRSAEPQEVPNGVPHAVADLSQRPSSEAPSEERIPVRGVRKHTAAAMVASAFTAPHVTEFLQVDVTETMAAVRRARDLPEFAGVKVSPLLFVAKALLVAARRQPMINASWDEAAQEIVVKRPVNLGIAVAAERGLLVPNVKGADGLPLADLARAIDGLAATARAGKTTPADMAGGTITITNVGVFGVDAGTPILMPGEAAILAFGQVRDLPWVVAGELAVRKVTTLSLSFDHRIVDGELGSAVLRDVGSMLEDPFRILTWS
ncbi:MAG TPA: dihydrolipoamide acetyltransferase family protein [Trebonia sp.]|nr:dihydrolipoamide acetyltransferase family protein [Trebonia sp.]